MTKVIIRKNMFIVIEDDNAYLFLDDAPENSIYFVYPPVRETEVPVILQKLSKAEIILDENEDIENPVEHLFALIRNAPYVRIAPRSDINLETDSRVKITSILDFFDDDKIEEHDRQHTIYSLKDLLDMEYSIEKNHNEIEIKSHDITITMKTAENELIKADISNIEHIESLKLNKVGNRYIISATGTSYHVELSSENWNKIETIIEMLREIT